ncbi:ATP-binding cassette sub-family A member 3-like isoform X2 [Copidosoma floridanum]|uniref:ATP-binding cassette sub-family A member 3-like isoform X2 n=1 Tax=Copidosoma floridanum TaxID=29053 RepID=UPI0006C95C90|nr:ATP-binding cassette sub-family A member 3-like isoform X2 [Copidosoma floridanum]
MEWLRVLKLLLYKNLLVRKRQWITSLVGEFLVPVGVIVAVWAVRNLVAKESVPVDRDTVPDRIFVNDIFDKASGIKRAAVFFAPNNSFTNEIMEGVQYCLSEGDADVSLHGHATEDDVVRDFESLSIPEFPDAKRGAVIFKNLDPSGENWPKNLDYKIRVKDLNLKLKFNMLANMLTYYTYSMFLQLQYCVDSSFIYLENGRTTNSSLDFPEFSIRQVPYPPYVKYDSADIMFRRFFAAMAVAVFMIPLLIESVSSSNEKFIGVNVLMKMNGVSNALNLLSWLISGSVFVIVFCIVPITVLINFTTGGAIPYLNYGNSFIVGLALSVNIVHLFAYGMHVSAYFPTSLLIMFGILFCSCGIMVVQMFGLKEEQYFIVPYLGILFPNLLMYRTVEELNYFENIREGNQWQNLFSVGLTEYGFGGSMGMTLVLSMIGVLFHFTLAVYVNEINPGKYGVGKHPLFFLKAFRESPKYFNDDVEILEYNENGKPFELPSSCPYSPGIQIRNLKKSYNIGLFSGEKVDALKGVSIDFYKGTITSLLGHNGAGKTTMMSILTGMTSPSEGLVLVNYKNFRDHSQEIMNDIGLCTQVNMVFPNLTVREQLRFFAMLKGKEESISSIEQRVTELLKKLKMYEKRNFLPKDLSGGQKRRVCLGMALIGDPSILILDEPTSGLDPESRRIIWDILLKMRGQKTIIISTHDMEEADILGDRIAIMHTGQLRSYGTAMFLKKLIGQGNVEVTLSVEPWSNNKRILDELNSQGNIISADASKIVISLPNSPDLPDALDKLEGMKKELGVSGLSVSLLSLEQVFLKVTHDNDEPKIRESFSRVENKLTGRSLLNQNLRGLLYKKLVYTRKNISALFMMFFSACVTLFFLSLVFQKANFKYLKPDVVSMRLDQYEKPDTYYNSTVQEIGQLFEVTTRNSGGKAKKIQSDMVDALLDYARSNGTAYYDNHLIAGAEFQLTANESYISAYYSEKTSYSLPISMNLVSNSYAKYVLGSDYSITLSAQEMPTLNVTDESIPNGYSTGVFFIFFLLSAFAQFVFHPLRETTKNVKQLQRMTGVSCLTYWGVMFAFDLAVFLLLITLIVGGFATIDYIYDLKLFDTDGILIVLLLLVLFAINVLPLIYSFSFIDASTTSVLRLLTYVPMGLILVELIGLIFSATLDDNDIVIFLRPIQRTIFLLFPYVSLLHGQMSFFATAMSNARCRNMPNIFYDTKCTLSYYKNDTCCGLECYDGRCKEYKNYFSDFEKDVNLESSIVYLTCSPLIYFGLLVILEYQMVPKLIVRMRKAVMPETEAEEQVKKEKLSISERIAAMGEHRMSGIVNDAYDFKPENGTVTSLPNSAYFKNHDDRVFLVYELRKQYGATLAVKDVSFGVKERECFGLLGVNGAGKSTTFRIMTGQDVADNGVMYINDKEFNRHRKYFLSQMGYCPQNNALIKSLNAYDHLRLFARLRGIPEHQVETEVRKWINRLNLNACASQPSGTYSGGNMRRLNIAIALIGLPNLILLDEPTAGVDPEARRSLWNVIQSCQKSGQAVILTSHSMEECEALCNRLAIMVNGRLVCIGPSQELKQRFGAGYDIQIKMNPEKEGNQVDDIKCRMARSLDCKIVDENTGYLMYHVSPNETSWRKMYDVMSELKSEYDCIDDFSVLSSTLEQLFLLFARTATKDESMRAID